MADIYLAHDSLLERQVAIKILKRDFSRSVEFQERFVLEAKAAANLFHPNIVTVFDFGFFHSDPFIKCEDAARLMYRWAEVSVCNGYADIVVIPDLPDPAAFITVKYHRDKWQRWGLKLGQPVLTAVSRERKGWYAKLESEVLHHLRDIGVEHVFHSTQAANTSVVWTWENLGHRYGRTEHILRIVL